MHARTAQNTSLDDHPRAANPDRPSLATRVRPDRSETVRRIWAVIPCHNRPQDLRLLLADLERCEVPGRWKLDVTVVDNASTTPIALPPLPPPELPAPARRLIRLADNTGGAGGFNAGLAAIMREAREDDFIWLIDSDARVESRTLTALVRALADDLTLVAAGSALCDPDTGQPFEVGGHLDPSHGEYVQPPPPHQADSLIEAEYLAACSLLVRRWAVDRAGLLPDIFLNGDDVEWTMRLSRRTGGRLACVPDSRVRHPRPDRMRTWQRYYAARNAFVVMARAPQAGPLMRWRRAWREIARAATQSLVGRDDLAELHLRGLSDAAANRVRGRGFPGLPPCDGGLPLAQLPEALKNLAGQPALGAGLEPRALDRLRELLPDLHPTPAGPLSAGGGLRAATAIVRGMMRLATRTAPPIAIVSARARLADWLAGQMVVTVDQDRFAIRKLSAIGRAARLTSVVSRGAWHAARLAIHPPTVPEFQASASDASPAPAKANPPHPLTLSIIVLSFNRWSALERTLMALAMDDPAGGAKPEIIVVDNASSDGTPDRLRARFPDVHLIALDQNKGVEGFNIGAAQATGDVLLILDDDAEPDHGVLRRAMARMSADRGIDAVALHPRHPATGRSEWPFAEKQPPREDWPFMGCANLVRLDAWRRVGGYDAAFFLYRNDVDLAMKLLAAGGKVLFDPSWIVWHNTSPALTKSPRWCELATRNWIWLARRHGRGLSRWAGAALGYLRAVHLAGWRAGAQLAAMRGAIQGLFRAVPSTPAALHLDGRAFAAMLRIRRDQSGARPTPHPPKAELKPEALQVISK